MKKVIICAGIAVAMYSCISKREQQSEIAHERNKEAREDSLELAKAYKYQAEIQHQVFADVETWPVEEHNLEDAADDPAFWYNRKDPDASIVFGTNKKGGIYAYNLEGAQLAYYAIGEINNIDVRQDVLIHGDTLDILSGSNRTDNSIIVYLIAENGKLTSFIPNYRIDTSVIDEVYGYCMHKSKNGQAGFIVNGKNGHVQYFAYKPEAEGYLALKKEWKVSSQPEGMVADDEFSQLYIGEEEKGIWKIDLVAEDKQPKLITSSQKENNPFIQYDIEGLSIDYGSKSNGFLIASIQGSFSYALFDRINNNYLGSFTIHQSSVTDGVEETDGLDVFSLPINDQFPFGVLIVQDGFNYDGDSLRSQNFKLLDLDKVRKLFNGEAS